MAARPAPAFQRAASRTFTVNTTADLSLADPADTHCVAATNGRCSLRAAVQAANNLSVPVRIVLGEHIYTLSSGDQLEVTNPDGVSIVGRGARKTSVAGAGARLFYVTAPATGTVSGELFLTSLKMKGGSAANGGAVYLEDGYGSSLVLDRVVATDNTASGYGGVIYTHGYSGVFVTDSRFTDNHAQYGGVVYAHWGDVHIIDSTLADNSTIAGVVGEGGALYTDYGVLRVIGGSISGNIAGDAADSGSGGAMYDAYGNISLVGVHIDHNTATNSGAGGAVYGVQDLIAVDHGSMRGNRVSGPSGDGGAIYQDYGSQVALHHASVTGNQAGSSTGAGEGGAVMVTANATFSDDGSVFTKNHALGDGAAGGAVFNTAHQSARFVGSRFIGNRAGPANGGSGFGGAVYTSDEGGTSFSRVTMAGNHAASYGGALYGTGVEYSTSVDRSTFSNNTAGNSASAGYGGALFLGDAVLSVENSTFTGNSARSVAGSPGQGGAIWHGGSRLGLLYSTVTGNSASQGGGVFSEAHGGTVLGDILSGNRASPSGSEQDCSVEPGYSPLNSLGGNVLGQARCVTGRRSGDTVSRRLHLGKLRDNGGPTRTMALAANSPAVGRASYLVPATDQRGHARPTNRADAGSYERPAH